MSAKGGGVSLYERRGKEDNSTHMSVLTTVGGSATDSTRIREFYRTMPVMTTKHHERKIVLATSGCIS